MKWLELLGTQSRRNIADGMKCTEGSGGSVMRSEGRCAHWFDKGSRRLVAETTVQGAECSTKKLASYSPDHEGTTGDFWEMWIFCGG